MGFLSDGRQLFSPTIQPPLRTMSRGKHKTRFLISGIKSKGTMDRTLTRLASLYFTFSLIAARYLKARETALCEGGSKSGSTKSKRFVHLVRQRDRFVTFIWVCSSSIRLHHKWPARSGAGSDLPKPWPHTLHILNNSSLIPGLQTVPLNARDLYIFEVL